MTIESHHKVKNLAHSNFGKEGWTPKRLPSLNNKTYLITGANAGAGFEATKTLISKGARVVMLCRNSDKAHNAMAQIKQKYAGADLSFIKLDLSSLTSVRSASEEIKSKVPHIDALICNAAIAQVAKQTLTVDGFESQLGTNHFGHFLLCGLLFEQINASKGRIVVVGSLAYKMGLKKIQFDDLNFDHNYKASTTYSQSKLAQMMFAYELQRRIKEAGKNVAVHVCHPGAARTELGQDVASLGVKILFKLLAPLAQSAEKGSWPEVLCATEENLDAETLYGPTKRGGFVGAINKCPLLPHVLEREVADKLWVISEEKTGFCWSP